MKDEAGNEVTIDKRQGWDEVFYIDKQKPKVEEVKVSPDEVRAGTTLTVTVVFTEDEASGINYEFPPLVSYIPYGSDTPIEIPGKFEAVDTWPDIIIHRITWNGSVEVRDVPDSQNGYAKIRVKDLRDMAGNKNEVYEEEDFLIDTKAPSATISKELPERVTDLPISISYNASDPAESEKQPASGIKEVTLWYRLEGETSWTDSGLSPEAGVFSFPIDGVALGMGTYEFSVVAEDNAGNVEDHAVDGSIFYTTDIVAPSISSISLPSIVSTGKLEVTISVLDLDEQMQDSINYDKIPDVKIKLSDGTTKNIDKISYTSGEWKGQVDVESGWTNGDAVIEVSGVEDLSGNAASVSGSTDLDGDGIPDNTLVIDTIAPSSEAKDLASYITSSPINVDYMAQDSTTYVTRITLLYRVAGETGWTTGPAITPADKDSEKRWEGTFAFDPAIYNLGDDVELEFCTLAEDAAGNVEQVPSTPDVSTRYNTSSVKAEIGPSGGSVSIEGNIELAIPEGAVEDKVTLEARPLSLVESGQVNATSARAVGIAPILGTTYEISPSGFVFDKEVTLTIYYDERNLGNIDESGLAMFYWDEIGWAQLSTSVVDTTGNTVSARVRHLSTFTIAKALSSPSGDRILTEVRLTLNPFKPEQDGETRFVFALSQEADITIKIYDTLGNLVRTITTDERESVGTSDCNRVPGWDGKDDGGNLVGSGIYIYQIKAEPTSGGDPEVVTKAVGVLR
jgi:hypothetical protein